MSERIKMDFIGAALQNLKIPADSVGRAPVASIEQNGAGRGLAVGYYFLAGRGEVALAGQDAHCVAAGDLIFVPHGEKHALRDTLSEPAGSSVLYAVVQGGMGGDCPFIAALPSLLILKAGERGAYPFMEGHLQSLVSEAGTGGAASNLVLARLWEVVFLLAFRSYLCDTPHGTKGWLAIIGDPPLARVLGAMQTRPDRAWTIEMLAGEAAMSRATFIRQFVRVMGEAPMKFLYLHRMGVAASLLRQGDSNLAAIAAHVGYRSEAAFSNAFRRHFGTAPGAYRTANARARNL